MFQILIVDDDKNLKRALSLLLTDSGYRTFSAGSARRRSIPWKNAASTSWCWRQPFPAWMVSLSPNSFGTAKMTSPSSCFPPESSPPTLRRASSPAWMIMSRNPSIPRNLPFGQSPSPPCKDRLRAPACYWKYRLGYDTFSVTTDGRSRSCPRRNFACSTSSYPTPTRYLPACSSWMTSGAPPPSPPPPPSASTSTASETASAMQKTSPSSPSAASAIRHR